MDFYTGYLNCNSNVDYLADILVKTLDSIVSSTENRLARMQFKEAVELAKISHMMAPLCDLDDEQLRRLHISCVDEVKRINGTIRFDRAVTDVRMDAEA